MDDDGDLTPDPQCPGDEAGNPCLNEGNCYRGECCCRAPYSGDKDNIFVKCSIVSSHELPKHSGCLNTSKTEFEFIIHSTL